MKANPAFGPAWKHLDDHNALAIAFFYEAEARFVGSPRIGEVGEYALGWPFCSLNDHGYQLLWSAVAGSGWLVDDPRRADVYYLSINPVPGRIPIHMSRGEPWARLPSELVGRPLWVDLRRSDRVLRRDLSDHASEIELLASVNAVMRWVREQRTAQDVAVRARHNAGDRGRESWGWNWLAVLDGGKPTTTSMYNQRRRAIDAVVGWRAAIGEEWLHVLAWGYETAQRNLRCTNP